MTTRDLRIVKKPSTPTEADLQRQAVQRLANSVRDEQHWLQVLDSASSPESRDELERVVGPMLPFRRAAVCTTPDCASGQPGTWQPVLVVTSTVNPEAVSWVPIELRLCEACKTEATLSDFLTDDIWKQILEQIESGWPPVRRLTTLTFDRIH